MVEPAKFQSLMLASYGRGTSGRALLPSKESESVLDPDSESDSEESEPAAGAFGCVAWSKCLEPDTVTANE